MRKVLLLLMLGSLYVACKQQKEGNQAQAAAPNDSQVNIDKLTIQFENAIQLDSSAYIMLPLTMSEKANSESFIDSRTYKDTDKLGYWNIIFYNTETDTFHLLDEKKKMLIHTIDKNEEFYSEYETPIHKQYIFYTITSFDSNHDKILNREDFTYLYISDRTGKKFRQISPSNYHVTTWKLIQGQNKLIMLVTRDSNTNRKIDAMDEIIPFTASLTDTLPAKELFNTATKKEIKKLFDRDWKRIK